MTISRITDIAADPQNAAVVATGLTKRYGGVVALDGLDLSVPTGTVLGLLGPNGAGKTTAVSILTTLIAPDSGSARVAGVDVVAQPQRVRSLIGLSGQYAAVDEHLTATENLVMIGCLYGMRRKEALRRTNDLLERFRLTDSAHRPLKTFSGGMRRRIDLAGALLADPPVLFLDEPTTGLDPRSRGELWDVIRERVGAGTTVVLTTQYLEEADQLADEIVVIDHGRAIARGTSQELKRRIGGEHLDVHLARAEDLARVEAVLREVAIGAIRTETEEALISVPVAKGVEALGTVMAELTAQNVEIVDIGLRRPTLDDVFMELTGQKAQEVAS
ncbi:MAG: ATP-binding cassette domain-containing protein [Ilumatobacteraceae bacterium]|nr:ATP-binding cassette domain-containing protein [Ilumatobacteraceae bacterium]